ncbi:MAG: serine/threonine-protein phosphatase [Gemmatimonadetes bacterium]|nr:serine/threonine-protein phosphatase [Gemmatimonadota bacterium]
MFREFSAVAGDAPKSLASPPQRPRHPAQDAPSDPPNVLHLTSVFGMSDVGKTRTRNEDSWSLVPGLGAAVVADGMGGHPGGDLASRIAADAAVGVLREEFGAESRPGEPLHERMSAAMRRSVMSAHEAIRARAEREPELDGMGTTLTALAVDPATDLFVLGNVGDSRAYRFRAGELTRLTRDDTWVQERLDAKRLTPEQARRHPFAHLLTQCLGLEDTPKPRITEGTVQVGDAYLLCSDGLVGM